MSEKNLKRNKEGYGYKYTDLAQIHNYLEANNMQYIQKIERLEGDDYIFTKRYINGNWEEEWLQGCRVVQAILQGKQNPAQEQGSALTYARRYSLLMAFGLATEDDDAQSLNMQNNYKSYNEVISDDTAEAFENWLDTNYVSQETLDQVLKQFNYKNIFEIKQKDLKTITNKIQEKLKGE